MGHGLPNCPDFLLQNQSQSPWRENGFQLWGQKARAEPDHLFS